MHQPVLVREILEGLHLSEGKTIVDATIGGGGHAGYILKKILPGGRLIGIDCDEEAIGIAQERLKNYNDALFIIKNNFRNLDTVLSALRIKTIDGALFDAGVSSYQLESAIRGFGIHVDAPLDMRMDVSNPFTAQTIVNRYREKALADLFYRYGEEYASRRIARAIVRERSKEPISTTSRLAKIVRRAVSPKRGRFRIHPATKVFQALRIAVNDELQALTEGLKKASGLLCSGARLCVISFHSLEDRIVKNYFKQCAKDKLLRILTKRPLTPSPEEVAANPRSRSAKLRIAEKL